MKNHFIYSYFGNKRQEVEHIYNNINLDGINTIIEPFCGSCSLSYYIWSQNKDKDYKYILNDLDYKLIGLLRLIKEGKCKELEDGLNDIRQEILKYENDMIKAKEIYINYIKNNGLKGYLLSYKCYRIRPALFPNKDFKRHFNDKKINLSTCPIVEFLTTANIELYNEDGNKIIEKYDNDKTFIFLDPPYIASCNNFYSNDNNDNTGNIYEMITNKGLNNFKSKILICHENNWLFKILFRDYLEGETEYNKKYQYTTPKKGKKDTSHICVKNYKI